MAMNKRELADALKLLPLGKNANHLLVIYAMTGERQQGVAKATGISESMLSRTARGFREATDDEKAVLAKHFGVPVAALFPTLAVEARAS